MTRTSLRPQRACVSRICFRLAKSWTTWVTGLWSAGAAQRSADACSFLNEDPWEASQNAQSVMPKTPLQMLLRGQEPLLGYKRTMPMNVDAGSAKVHQRSIGHRSVSSDRTRTIHNMGGRCRSTLRMAWQGLISYTKGPSTCTAGITSANDSLASLKMGAEYHH